MERLLERAITSGRVDDTVAIFEKRYEGYLEDSLPVIEHLKSAKVRLIEVSCCDPVMLMREIEQDRYLPQKMEKQDGSNSKTR